MPPKIQLVTDPKKAKALSSTTRLKILQEIAANSQSISQLARTFKISPAAVLYHVKKLQTAGFIRIAKTVVINNNLTEKYYEMTTSSYLVAVSGMNQSIKGPVPPKKQEKLLLSVTSADVEKMLGQLGLTYLPENKAKLEEDMHKLLELAVHEAATTQREILNQSENKLSHSERLKIEHYAMAVFPIVVDRILSNEETLATLRSIVGMLQKSSK
jgi:DNA-binding transcriptional ArsR family regulator